MGITIEAANQNDDEAINIKPTPEVTAAHVILNALQHEIDASTSRTEENVEAAISLTTSSTVCTENVLTLNEVNTFQEVGQLFPK